MANIQHLRRLAFKFSVSENIFGQPLPNGPDLPAFRNLLLTNQVVQHLCFGDYCNISPELLNIIAAGSPYLRGIELQQGTPFFWNNIKRFVKQLDQQHKSIEWVISEEVGCVDDANMDHEWVIGMYFVFLPLLMKK